MHRDSVVVLYSLFVDPPPAALAFGFALLQNILLLKFNLLLFFIFPSFFFYIYFLWALDLPFRFSFIQLTLNVEFTAWRHHLFFNSVKIYCGKNNLGFYQIWISTGQGTQKEIFDPQTKVWLFLWKALLDGTEFQRLPFLLLCVCFFWALNITEGEKKKN